MCIRDSSEIILNNRPKLAPKDVDTWLPVCGVSNMENIWTKCLYMAGNLKSVIKDSFLVVNRGFQRTLNWLLVKMSQQVFVFIKFNDNHFQRKGSWTFSKQNSRSGTLLKLRNYFFFRLLSVPKEIHVLYQRFLVLPIFICLTELYSQTLLGNLPPEYYSEEQYTLHLSLIHI